MKMMAHGISAQCCLHKSLWASPGRCRDKHCGRRCSEPWGGICLPVTRGQDKSHPQGSCMTATLPECVLGASYVLLMCPCIYGL